MYSHSNGYYAGLYVALVHWNPVQVGTSKGVVREQKDHDCHMNSMANCKEPWTERLGSKDF